VGYIAVEHLEDGGLQFAGAVAIEEPQQGAGD
jgi:hypothetical protein